MNSDDEDDNSEIIQKQFKVILLGDGAVGKTSIAKRFSQDTFGPQYKQTLWDIGGQSIGSRSVRNYISGANAALLCYDITNYESFANLEDWYRLVVDAFEGEEMPQCALIANKTDLKHMAQVSLVKHTQFLEENDMLSFQISAKSGDQIQLCFFKVAAHLLGIEDAVPTTEATTMGSVLPATIIDSQRHDEDVNGGKVGDYTKEKSGCALS